LLLGLVGMLSTPYIAMADSGIVVPFNKNTVQHLPNLNVDAQGKGEGITGIKAITTTVKKYLDMILGTIAVLMLFIAGYNLVTAQSSISEEKEKQKMNIVYITLGLIVVWLSSSVVYNYLFPLSTTTLLDGTVVPVPETEGEFLLTEQGARTAAQAATAYIKRVLNIFLSFSGSGAILMLVITSLRLIINPGADDQMEQQKKVVGYTAVGIIIIGMADRIVNVILFPDGGRGGVQVEILNMELQGLSNYVLGFLGVIAFVTFIISGVMMVVNAGNEEVTTKVKSTLKNVVIGCIVAYSAYTVVFTLIETFTSG